VFIYSDKIHKFLITKIAKEKLESARARVQLWLRGSNWLQFDTGNEERGE